MSAFFSFFGIFLLKWATQLWYVTQLEQPSGGGESGCFGGAGLYGLGGERSVLVQQRQVPKEAPGMGRLFLLALMLGVSATFMALAVQTPRHFWLGWITLLPLMQSARSLTPGGAFCAGSFWGAALFWASALIGSDNIAFTVPSFLILTLGPALYGCFGAWLTRRVGFSPYLMALGWVGVEFCLRPVGLEHGLLAGTQSEGMLFRVAGSFAGYFLVAFLVAYLNASLLSVLHTVTRSCTGLRLISSACGLFDRLVALETPFIRSRVLCVSHARAPPLS